MERVSSNRNIINGVFYRPLQSDKIDFVNAVNNHLHTVDNRNKPLILLGDFNIDLPKTDVHTRVFLNIMYADSLVLLIICSTRTTDTSSSLTDHMFCTQSISD